MSRRGWITGALVGAFFALVAISYFAGTAISPQTGFTGSDSAATTAIQESHPNYQPWFQPVFTPGSTEIESGIFAMFAAVGAGVLGFVIGRLWERRHSGSAPDSQQMSESGDPAKADRPGECPGAARTSSGQEPN